MATGFLLAGLGASLAVNVCLGLALRWVLRVKTQREARIVLPE